MDQQKYIRLYERYIAGTATPAEKARLLAHQDGFELRDPAVPATPEELAHGRGLLERIEAEAFEPVKVRRLWSKIGAAAAILLIAGAGIYLNRQTVHPTATTPTAQVQHPAKRFGGYAAPRLTLAGGRTIRLDSARQGILAKTKGSLIRKSAEGQLAYESQTNAGESPVEYHTMTIPRGGRNYELVLPDGTKVWLNSASSLTYPTRFTGKERLVQLSGEAYFEVTKNAALPFRVAAGRTSTTVLGTHFNIQAYPGEKTRTTLLEGSVRFSNAIAQVLLHPGEAGTEETNLALSVAPASETVTLAWKNNQFIFSRQTIGEIMRQVSRWYNVDVSFEGNSAAKVFGGVYSRDKDLEQLLQSFALTGKVHFKMEEGRVIVMD